MIRLLLIVMFGLIVAFPVAAQESSDPLQMNPVVTNAIPSSQGGLSLPTGPQNTGVQPVHILRDDSRSSENEEDVDTNAVKQTKAAFLLSTGIEYADEGEFEEAVRAYQRALEVDPDDEQTLMRLGSVYVQMKKFTEAVDAFQKLLDLDPENPLAHNNLAWCYAIGPEVRNVPLSLRHSRDALLFAPNMPSVWNTLAEAYYVSGDYDKALRSAEQAIFLLQFMKEEHEETLRSFEAQAFKIKRAKEATEMLTGSFPDKGKE